MLYHISRSSRAQSTTSPAATRSNEPNVETLVREAAEWRLQHTEEPASRAKASTADEELLASVGCNMALRSLIEGGHSVDSRGRTAVHLAAAGGQHECLALLLRAKPARRHALWHDHQREADSMWGPSLRALLRRTHYRGPLLSGPGWRGRGYQG